MGGAKETCFKADNITVTNNGQGDIIKFEQITLATFLQWSDELEKFLECVHGIGIEVDATNAVDASTAHNAVSTASELNPLASHTTSLGLQSSRVYQ